MVGWVVMVLFCFPAPHRLLFGCEFTFFGKPNAYMRLNRLGADFGMESERVDVFGWCMG